MIKKCMNLIKDINYIINHINRDKDTINDDFIFLLQEIRSEVESLKYDIKIKEKNKYYIVENEKQRFDKCNIIFTRIKNTLISLGFITL